MMDLGVKQYDDCDLEYVCCNSGSSPRPRDGTRGADRPLHARSYQLRARTRPAIAMAIARPTLSCRIAFEYSFDEFSGYAVSRYRGTMIPRTGTAPGATRSRSPRAALHNTRPRTACATKSHHKTAPLNNDTMTTVRGGRHLS
jgi:hypothetical protein